MNGIDRETETISLAPSQDNVVYNFLANGANVVQVRWTYSNGAFNHFYYLKDHLGSVRMTVNAQGGVVGYNDYYPFGLTMPGRSMSSSADPRYTFTGKEQDVETTLDYGVYPALGGSARYYDSWRGQWLSVDPMAEKYLGLSPYNYTANNPIVLIDAHGDTVTFADDNIKKETMDFYNEKDSKGNYVNGSFRNQFDELNASTQVYNVSLGDVNGEAQGLTTTFDGKVVSIILDPKGSLSFGTIIAHEFAHGQQFEEGEIGFYRDSKGQWSPFNYDITDETKAYDAMLGVAKASDYWSIGGKSVLGEYDMQDTQAKKEAFLRGHGYEECPTGPLNNTATTQAQLQHLGISQALYRTYKGQ